MASDEKFIKAHRYSQEELIVMRHMGASIFDTKKLSQDGHGCLNIPTTSSNNRRRATRSEPAIPAMRGFSNTSEWKVDNTKHWSLEDEQVAVQQSSDLTWQLRRRDQTTSSSDQPLSAPCGFDAQTSENFQKFYRAVVSPSHVRVTAGGRIVPNYPKPPPLFVWNGQEQYFETAGVPTSTKPTSPSTQGVPRNCKNSRDISNNANTMNDFNDLRGFKIETLPSGRSKQNPIIPGKQAVNTTILTTSPNNKFSELSQGAFIKISPPGQFDASKPFMYNGQLVYPMSVNGPQTTFTTVDAMGGFQPNIGPQVSQAPSAPEAAYPPQHSLPVPIFPFPIHQPGSGLPVIPSLSGIAPPTSLVEQQINTLQQQLKFLKDQLDYNKGQINAEVAEEQRCFAYSQLQALQYGMSLPPMQSIFKTGGTNRPDATTSAQSQAFTKEAVVDMRYLNHPITNNVLDAATTSLASSVNEMSQQHKTQLNHSLPTLCKPQGVAISEPRTCSQSRARRSAFTAMAPEFKPRSQIASCPTDKENSISDGLEQGKDCMRHVLRRSVNDISDSGQPMPVSHSDQVRQTSSSILPSSTATDASYYALDMLSTAKPHSMYGLGGTGPYSTLLPKSSAVAVGGYDGAETPSAYDAAEGDDIKVPYLTGHPPTGIPWVQAKPYDLVYHRPLTDKEKQARELYFGRGPKDSVRGLPRYDGCDFYFAVPPQKITTQDTTSNTVGTLKSGHDTSMTGFGDLRRQGSGAVHELGSGTSSEGSFYERVSSRPVSRASNLSDGRHARSFRNSPDARTLTTGKVRDDSVSVKSWVTPRASTVLKPEALQMKSVGVFASKPHGPITSGSNIRPDQSQSKANGPPPAFFQGMKRLGPRDMAAVASISASSSAGAAAFLPHEYGSGSLSQYTAAGLRHSGSDGSKSDAASLFGKLAVTAQAPVQETAGTRGENVQPPRRFRRSARSPTTAAELLRRLARGDLSGIDSYAASGDDTRSMDEAW